LRLQSAAGAPDTVPSATPAEHMTLTQSMYDDGDELMIVRLRLYAMRRVI